jgi:hypothetical protein
VARGYEIRFDDSCQSLRQIRPLEVICLVSGQLGGGDLLPRGNEHQRHDLAALGAPIQVRLHRIYVIHIQDTADEVEEQVGVETLHD